VSNPCNLSIKKRRDLLCYLHICYFTNTVLLPALSEETASAVRSPWHGLRCVVSEANTTQRPQLVSGRWRSSRADNLSAIGATNETYWSETLLLFSASGSWSRVFVWNTPAKIMLLWVCLTALRDWFRGNFRTRLQIWPILLVGNSGSRREL